MERKLLKKLLIFICMITVCRSAISAQIVNVEYVHKLLNHVHGVDIAYSSYLYSEKQAVNMKYLLTLIDIANSRLTGRNLTQFGSDTEFATLDAVDTVAASNAIDNLITYGPFIMATTPDTTEFSFDISAQGRFLVDWGDNTPIQVFRRNNTENETISHTYARAKAYTIKLYGRATDYNNDSQPDYTAAISFANNTNLAGIDGNLGHIFPTLKKSNNNPYFYRTFYKCTNLSSTIPEDLFTGVYGHSFFWATFSGCEKLSGQIPSGLFRNITGNKYRMFKDTFKDCKSLTGSIPEDLFEGITYLGGATFMNTFENCSGLTGTIPEKLFSRIHGTTYDWEFGYTFLGCTGLSGYVPAGLFAGITKVTSASAFFQTFTQTNLMTQCPANTPTAPQPDTAEWTVAVCGTPCTPNETLVDNICVTNE